MALPGGVVGQQQQHEPHTVAPIAATAATIRGPAIARAEPPSPPSALDLLVQACSGLFGNAAKDALAGCAVLVTVMRPGADPSLSVLAGSAIKEILRHPDAVGTWNAMLACADGPDNGCAVVLLADEHPDAVRQDVLRALARARVTDAVLVGRANSIAALYGVPPQRRAESDTGLAYVFGGQGIKLSCIRSPPHGTTDKTCVPSLRARICLCLPAERSADELFIVDATTSPVPPPGLMFDAGTKRNAIDWWIRAVVSVRGQALVGRSVDTIGMPVLHALLATCMFSGAVDQVSHLGIVPCSRLLRMTDEMAALVHSVNMYTIAEEARRGRRPLSGLIVSRLDFAFQLWVHAGMLKTGVSMLEAYALVTTIREMYTGRIPGQAGEIATMHGRLVAMFDRLYRHVTTVDKVPFRHTGRPHEKSLIEDAVISCIVSIDLIRTGLRQALVGCPTLTLKEDPEHGLVWGSVPVAGDVIQTVFASGTLGKRGRQRAPGTEKRYNVIFDAALYGLVPNDQSGAGAAGGVSGEGEGEGEDESDGDGDDATGRGDGNARPAKVRRGLNVVDVATTSSPPA